MMESLRARIRWALEVFRRLLSDGQSESPEIPVANELSPLACFDLQPPQIEGLWLLACCEIEPAIARMAAAAGTPDMPDVSIAIWQQLIERATGQALTSRMLDELVQLGLIETTREPRLPAHRRWVRASDRVIELARGEIVLDREVAEVASLIFTDRESEESIPAAIARAFETTSLIIATGADGSGRATLLGRAAARAGRCTLRVRCADLAPTLDTLARQIRAIRRECILFDALPLLEDADLLPEPARRVAAGLFELPSPVLATMRPESGWSAPRPVVIHAISPPTTAESLVIWKAVLADCEQSVVDAAATTYAIAPGKILATADSAIASAGSRSAVTIEHVHAGLRAHLDQLLGNVASRVECTQTWHDLVLPADQMDQIVELVARVRHRAMVLEDWGFARKVGRGLGLAALMSGPPGTGKTMVAGLVAQELGLDLYQVDLSRVVSKYVGETEKNLGLVFDAAECGHAVILFDEADSLFAKRSEVRSSNDRYANLEVNYLLQRMEHFDGISILTTNHESALDEAFRRRLAIHVRFPIPDEEHRELLWRTMIPAEAPVEQELNFVRLARDFEMTGGYIKNSVLRAAYLAANDGSAITTSHLQRAARTEYEAMGKVAFGV